METRATEQEQTVTVGAAKRDRGIDDFSEKTITRASEQDVRQVARP